jgi:hypothetical protein
MPSDFSPFHEFSRVSSSIKFNRSRQVEPTIEIFPPAESREKRDERLGDQTANILLSVM